MRRLGLLTALLCVLAVYAGLAAGQACATEYGVYVKAVEKAAGTFDEVVKKTEEALGNAGWKVLASYESGVKEDCGLRAHNIVINSEEYASRIMGHGPLAAYALPLRVGVYEDEQGIHIAFVNPASINRTILGDDVEVELSAATMDELSKVIATAVKGQAASAQIGQLRDKGRVGGMGGGDFMKKVETIYEAKELEATKTALTESIRRNDKGWKLVYTLELKDTVIFGVTKPATEARAFDIAGDKRESKTYRCPGLDHAAAFPIEVVAYLEGDTVKVTTLDEMYRMKLYFEDAGNWAFMKNMTMPGKIEDEVKEICAPEPKAD